MVFDALANNILLCGVAAWGGYMQNFGTVKSYIFLTGNFNSYTSKLCGE